MQDIKTNEITDLQIDVNNNDYPDKQSSGSFEDDSLNTTHTKGHKRS